MDNNIIQFVGGPCGQHGPYTFYKAFKYKKNGLNKIVTLSEFFFVKLWMDSDLLCIGELQLLWIDKNSEQVLASLRLYFLPENTPDGRMDHGEDEVLAIAEKVVLRVEDLVTWITMDAEWTWGRLGKCNKVKEPPDGVRDDYVQPVSLSESSLDFSDVEKEKRLLGTEENNRGPSVVILSYPRYCRYRAMMRRLEGVENEYLKHDIVRALGGFSFSTTNTRVMFCRDTFEYPELEGHEMLCNHLAPKLKGRPRGKRKKRSVSPGSESNESESSVLTSCDSKSKITSETSNGKNGICIDGSLPRRSTRSTETSDTKEFMKKLTIFMKSKKTPLGRTPCLGFKEIDLHEFYTKVQKLGGYDAVTSNRLWKSIFDDISGHQNSTGAATIMRRHYERFLLSYERHLKGEEYKPLPVSERRRLKTKSANIKCELETSGWTSSDSGTTTPLSSATTSIPSSPSNGESKEANSSLKQEAKTSSLRSVRVKPERQKEKFAKVVKIEEITSTTGGLEIIKVEMKNIEDVTQAEIKEEKPEITSVKIEGVTSNNEPLTSAIAPIVQKIGSPSKTPSPIECKENIPLIKTGDIATTNEKELLIVKVPSNPVETDETDQKVNFKDIKSELSEVGNSSGNASFVEELKRGKLDILKEGGLEVTPVRTFSSPSMIQDVRPSVIQTMGGPQVNSKHMNDLQQMPPPIQNLPMKRLPINIPQSLNISKVAIPTSKSSNVKVPVKPFSYPAKTQSLPPKVVQSRSIYTYSENTVYGNPKDCLVNSYPVHTPKAPVNLKKQTGGDLLDLTVTSPQKPIIEMRIPGISSTAHSSRISSSKSSRNFVKAATLPILEGRKLGSNLEITLVDSTGKTSSPFQQNSKYSSPQAVQSGSTQFNSHKSPHKRSSNTEASSNNKIQKFEENGKYNKPSTSNYNRERGQPIDLLYPFGLKPSSSKTETNASQGKPVQETKGFPAGVAFPHYLSQLYEGNKAIAPYFPMIDPLLYSAAMQSLYPQASMNPSSPFLQFATQEQLKLYSELIAQHSRVPIPFQMPLQDEEFSNNLKKS